MENWCYDDKTLYGFAKHFETGEPLPKELFAKIKDAKNFQAGMLYVVHYLCVIEIILII